MRLPSLTPPVVVAGVAGAALLGVTAGAFTSALTLQAAPVLVHQSPPPPEAPQPGSVVVPPLPPPSIEPEHLPTTVTVLPAVQPVRHAATPEQAPEATDAPPVAPAQDVEPAPAGSEPEAAPRPAVPSPSAPAPSAPGGESERGHADDAGGHGEDAGGQAPGPSRCSEQVRGVTAGRAHAPSEGKAARQGERCPPGHQAGLGGDTDEADPVAPEPRRPKGIRAGRGARFLTDVAHGGGQAPGRHP